MTKLKNAFIAIMVMIALAFVSCENDKLDTAIEGTSAISGDTVDNELNTAQNLQRRARYNISDLPLKANIPYYHHLAQMSIERSNNYPSVGLTCGQTSYLVARRAISNSFPKPQKQNVVNLHKWLCDRFISYRNDPMHYASIYYLTTFAKEVDNLTVRTCHKEARPVKGGGKNDIDYNHPARNSFKKWLEGELRAGRPVICPATSGLSSSGMGHFFIVVGLDRIGSELMIKYKDVLYNDSSTKEVPYTKFLDAIWYLHYDPKKPYSGGTYACSFYTGYSLEK